MPLLPDAPAMIRLTDATYADGIAGMGTTGDAATIASQLFDQEGAMPNAAGLSAFMVLWGQFIDHDLSLTRDASGEFLTVEGLMAPFQRSVFDASSGTGTDNPRMPVNEITAAMDASMVYGSTMARTTALRAFEDGLLKMGPSSAIGGDLLPLASEENFMAGLEASDSPVFLAGDIRGNENVALTALHTVMSREHNHWATRLAAENPGWNDEELFQAARAIVEYEIQSITYNDWLPHLLGDTSLAASAGVAADEGQISVEFSTAAYRIGHTMVTSAVRLLDEAGQSTVETPLEVRDVFFNPEPIHQGHLDAILRGQLATLAEEVDAKIIDDLNFFLQAPDGMSGFSLAALNILRGRDHGLERYLEVRAALLGDVDPGTVAANDFSVITSDAADQAALAAVYASVHDVDLWVGGLIEDKADDALVGPVFSHILSDQFFRTRAADDGFMVLPETISQEIREELAGVSVQDILLRTTGIETTQDDPFLAMDRLAGTDENDTVTGGAGAEMLFGLWGDDRLTGGGGDDILNGGKNEDIAVMTAARDSYWVAAGVDGVQVTDKRGQGDGSDWLIEVETLSFLDMDWSAAEIASVFDLAEADICALVEIYVAYFDRAPDATGLIFWAGVMADGMTLDRISAHFHDQDETRLTYPDPDDTAGFVGHVYENVLGRVADPLGLTFWTAMLDSGAVAAEDFVMLFLQGTRSDAHGDQADQQAADRAYLKDKVELGLYYGVIKGMGDVAEAGAVMALYDGTAESLLQAAGAVETLFDAAMEEGSDALLLSLVGLVEDPFAGMI